MIAKKIKKTMERAKKAKKAGKDVKTYIPEKSKKDFYDMIDLERTMDKRLRESYYLQDSIKKIERKELKEYEDTEKPKIVTPIPGKKESTLRERVRIDPESIDASKRSLESTKLIKTRGKDKGTGHGDR